MEYVLKFQLSVIAKCKNAKKIPIKINMLTRGKTTLKIHHRRLKQHSVLSVQ